MTPPAAASAACAQCPVHHAGQLVRLGVDMERWDYVVALAGNPNTGKSTVFNALTGLRQHTGNWPGKTVARAEGGFSSGGRRYKLVDLPGTYSLLSSSPDEEIARDFLVSGKPDVTVIVVDATRLERNLNLALQVLEISNRVVVCVNLVDEARRNGLEVDVRRLARDLGVPVVATAARSGEGLDELRRAMAEVATGEAVCRPRRLDRNRSRDLDRDLRRDLDQDLDSRTDELRLFLDGDLRLDLHGAVTASNYDEAARLAGRAVIRDGAPERFDWQRALDRLVTSRTFGFPVMLLLLTAVFWITIAGANVPSAMLSSLLVDRVHPWLVHGATAIGLPWWLRGLLLDGMYLSTAWVVSVMLPPMAIFFPLFTLLEDFGYLPRVAFNLDRMFQRVGAHGKQALTMTMGWGCNAAAIVSTRIIDSPRERLIAILTNNFALCNGRWPTQILIASIFIGGLVPAYLAGLFSALSVVAVAVLGVALTFATSWILSRTILKGEASTFSLELPPYRPPQILRTLYTSVIDRTLIVLWRAVVFALPAGAIIWLLSNVSLGGTSLAEHAVALLDPFGVAVGLSGIVLLAYVIAIPANEIVIPTILMLTVLVTGLHGFGPGADPGLSAGAGVLFELDSQAATAEVLRAGGFTLLVAVNLMLFSLVHNPCSTTLYTIWKETRSAKWTALSALLPLAMGFALCATVTWIWRLAAGG